MAATITQTQSHRSFLGSAISLNWLDKACEIFWFTLCLGLFMVLGPFSAPIVLGYIFFGKFSDRQLTEPDPVNQVQ